MEAELTASTNHSEQQSPAESRKRCPRFVLQLPSPLSDTSRCPEEAKRDHGMSDDGGILAGSAAAMARLDRMQTSFTTARHRSLGRAFAATTSCKVEGGSGSSRNKGRGELIAFA